MVSSPASHDRLGLARQGGESCRDTSSRSRSGYFFLRDQQRAARQRNRLARGQRRKFTPDVVHRYAPPDQQLFHLRVTAQGRKLSMSSASSDFGLCHGFALARSRCSSAHARRAPPSLPERPRRMRAHQRLPAPLSSVRARIATASRLPLLPSATATLRSRPRRLVRLTALLPKRRRKPSSSSASNSGEIGGQIFVDSRRAGRVVVPRTDLLADVAAEDPVAELRPQFAAGSDRDARSSGTRCTGAAPAGSRR